MYRVLSAEKYSLPKAPKAPLVTTTPNSHSRPCLTLVAALFQLQLVTIFGITFQILSAIMAASLFPCDWRAVIIGLTTF